MNIFETTSRFCREERIDTAQFLILTPLPGTEVYHNLDNTKRLLHKKWEYYDGQHAVFNLKLMTAEELQQGMLDAFEDFYNLTQMLNEALNESVYWVAEAYRRMLHLGSRPVQHSTLMKGVGYYIVKKWKRLNAHYFRYLEQLHASQSR